MDIANFNEEEFLKKVEKAAETGAAKGLSKNDIKAKIIIRVIVLALVLGGIFYFKFSLKRGWNDFKEQLGIDNSASEHDLVFSNHGFLGYKAADFYDVIIGDAKQLKKLEVYTAELTEETEIKKTGLFNLKIFSKVKKVEYRGSVVYTVDLSKLTTQDIIIDDDSSTVIIKIPHAVEEDINLPSEKMRFLDEKKGWLAFGSIELTLEENAKLQTEVKNKMREKLKDSNMLETADRLALVSVKEIYEPMIDLLTHRTYKVVVEFK